MSDLDELLKAYHKHYDDKPGYFIYDPKQSPWFQGWVRTKKEADKKVNLLNGRDRATLLAQARDRKNNNNNNNN